MAWKFFSALGEEKNESQSPLWVGPNAPTGSQALWLDTDELTPPVPVPMVGTLPASPVNGQEVYFTGSLSPWAIWHLRWASDRWGDGYQWEFLGGQPLYAEVTPDDTTSSTTYTALANAGPSLVLPLPGVYLIDLGMLGWCNAGSGAWGNYMSYDIGGTAAAEADKMSIAGSSAMKEATLLSSSRTRQKTLAAAVTLTAKYRINNNIGSQVGHFLERWMRVTPIRLSAA